MVLTFEESITLSPVDLVLHPRTRQVVVQGRKIEPVLTPKEFDVLYLLYQRRGEVVNKDEIANKGWPKREPGDVGDQEVQQIISHLRRKIDECVQPDHSGYDYVVTFRGYGYMLTAE